nr:hypothetical protein [Tanacetum cinerariifolium]
LRSSGRRLGKEVVIEPVNDDKYIDVNDEPSDDDFVDMGRNNPYASGLRRNGRNKDKEVYDSDHAKTVASGSKGKGEKQGRKRSRETTMPEAKKKAASDKPADEVERSIEKSKIMEIDDRPSFSFGVTQDCDVIPVTNNENTVLTPMPISAYTPEGEACDFFMFHEKMVTTKSNIIRSPFYSRVANADAALSNEENKVTKYLFLTNHESDTDILFKSKSSQQLNRLQMESLGRDYVETNILDTWAVVRNYMEEYRSNDSPFRLFLPTFVVDKESFSQIRNDDGRFERVLQHVESVTRGRSELNKLKKIDLDKILKKSKVKKGAKISNSIVAKMLHADFGRYVYGLDHIKSRNMITAELEIGEYDWQTATVRPYAGTSEGAHGARIWKYVARFAFEQRTNQDKMNGTLISCFLGRVVLWLLY